MGFRYTFLSAISAPGAPAAEGLVAKAACLVSLPNSPSMALLKQGHSAVLTSAALVFNSLRAINGAT